MTQVPVRLLILPLFQDPAKENSSSSPHIAIHVQVWGSLSHPAINQKRTLHNDVFINTQWPLLANKNFVSVKNLHCFSPVKYLNFSDQHCEKIIVVAIFV